MDATRDVRRQWISDESPSITTILKRYPRLQDMTDAVCTILSYCDVLHCIVYFL